MNITEIFIGFISGLLLAFAGGWINILLSRKNEKLKKLKFAEYEMYLKLLDLYNWYSCFSINKKATKSMYSSTYKVASELAQLLQQNEDTEYAQELLKILYDESYVSYDERLEHILSLSNKIASKVVPIHQKNFLEIGKNNTNLIANENFIAKAPATPMFQIKGLP